MKVLFLFFTFNVFYIAISQPKLNDKNLIVELNKIEDFPNQKKIQVLRQYLKFSFDDSSRAKIYKKLALAYFHSNNFESGLELLNTEIFYWKKYGNNFQEKVSDAFYNKAYFYHISFNYDQALKNYKICEKATNDVELKSICFKEISEIYIFFGDYINSSKYARQGINLLEKNNITNDNLALCYNALGISLEFLEKYDDALEKFQKALLILDRPNLNSENTYFLGNLLFNIGKVYGHKKDFNREMLFYQKSYALFKKSNNLRHLTLANSGIAISLLNNFNKITQSVKLFEKSISEIEKIQNKELKKSYELARFYAAATISFFNNKNYLEADKYAQKSIASIPNLNIDIEKVSKSEILKISDHWTFYDILRSHGKWYLHKKYLLTKNINFLNKEKIIYEKADILIDIMRLQSSHNENAIKFHWRDRTRWLYESAIETCFLLKDYEKAYYFMEKSRAVMLNDKLNELGAKQKLSEADQEKERDFKRKIIELNTKIEAETKATAKERLNSQLFDLQEQQERFVKSLETKYPAYYQLKYNTQIGSLKQIQEYLKTTFGKENSTMVSYFFGDSATYAMVISPSKVQLKQLKYNASQNQEFVNFLANNQGTKAQHLQILAAGSAIYEQLIQSLHLPKGHLIISQDGVFMPFEALSTSATKAHYLLNDYAISYTYSGQFLLKNQNETTFWPNKQFVGFAPVKFKNQLNTLYNSDVSLTKVSNAYWFSHTFAGQTATKSNFLTQAKDHEIVQLFTHAFADSADAEPQIYFADQSLKISELNAEEQFQTQLLVLSACKTGLGKLAKGEGILSLARGFSMLGIPATITSLWSVEDKSTYQLTELFYKYLNDGLGKDEALQKAKLAFLELSTNASPTDWAGMVLVGDTRPIHSNIMKYLLISTAFILLSTLLIGYYRFRNKRG